MTICRGDQRATLPWVYLVMTGWEMTSLQTVWSDQTEGLTLSLVSIINEYYWKSHRYTSVIFSESLKSTSWKVCSAESSQVKGVQRPKRVMIQQNTPTNKLIEVIQEKSHEFMVGFPFNTRVTTLNRSV